MITIVDLIHAVFHSNWYNTCSHSSNSVSGFLIFRMLTPEIIILLLSWKARCYDCYCSNIGVSKFYVMLMIGTPVLKSSIR